MPDLDGFGVIAELSARNVALPVILITAPVTGTTRRRAQEAGVFELLEKPLLGGALVDNIRRAIVG
jgi:FixJ family two-component response regulator